MVSQELTELKQGLVQWKPDPKDMPDSGNGPWKSYQIKVNEQYFDCAQKIYNAVAVDDDIQFTYSTKSFVYKAGDRQGETGYRYKIANLIGGADQPTTITPTPITPSGPQRVTPTVGMIGNLNGAEVGAMENRAWENARQFAALSDATEIHDEDIKELLVQQARIANWFKAQPVPNLDPEPIPLQDDPDYVPDRDEPVWNDDEPDMANRTPED